LTARWRALFWGVVLLNALPLFLVRHLPFTDLPEHVAAMATIARLLPGGGGAPYSLALRESQYLLYHLAGAVLTRGTGDAIFANKLLLGAVAVAWPLSLRSLLRAMGRDERAALFAPMAFWNRALMVGFLPFIASIPLALYALALAVRQCREPSRARAAALAVVTVVLFYAHASAWLVFVTIAGALAAASGWTERGAAKLTLRPLLAILPAFVPSALAAVYWWSAGSLADRGKDPDVARIAMLETLHLMPLWTFDVWTAHADEIAAGVWWIAFGTVVVGSLRLPPDAPHRALLALLPFGVLAIIYLVTPYRVGAAGYLNVRLAPLLTLFAVAALRLREGRWATVPLGLAVGATIFDAGVATFEMRRVAREKVGDLDALLAEIRPDARVALLNFATPSPRTQEWPYPFAGTLHRARDARSIVSYSFVELPHWPVHYVESAAPPRRAPFWVYHPCTYRMRDDGAFYDYVLVQGAVDPWPASTPGPPFAPLAHAGAFTLFEKVAGPPSDEPERGPCKPKLVDTYPGGHATTYP